MLSILVYGRNDSHGYNLHKRAALSLNAIAETLTHPDDEIIFVDYNTPDELPTFPEAIGDTLTDACKARLRVIRVRGAFHRQFAGKTRLVALESQSRNIAVRRANPANHWILSTNTDMIFCPQDAAASLTSVVSGLEDGFYHLPRFEMPEGFWERLDRRDPQAAIAQMRDNGKRFHLNEIVWGKADNLFEAPGDFQLFTRDDLHAVCGFDERMVMGWHVDSNIARRMRLFRGEVRNLFPRLSGYHCGHTRQATSLHGGNRTQNDFELYVASVDDPVADFQKETWGAPGEAFEEIRLDRPSPYLSAMAAAVPREGPEASEAAYNDTSFGEVKLDADHALPHLCDLLFNFPPGLTYFFFGTDVRLLQGLRDFLEAAGREARILICDLAASPDLDALDKTAWTDSVRPLDEALGEADVIILQHPSADMEPAEARSDAEWQTQRLFSRLADEEASRSERRRIIVVNAIHTSIANVVEFTLAPSVTPFSSRLRQGFVIDQDAGSSAPAPETPIYERLGRSQPFTPQDRTLLDRLFQSLREGLPIAGWERLAPEIAAVCASPMPTAAKFGFSQDEAAAWAFAADIVMRANIARAVGAPVAVGPRVEVGNRLLSGSDWDDVNWSRQAVAYFGPNVMSFRERKRWVWERASLALAVKQHLPPRADGRPPRVLVLANGPEYLAAVLTHMGYEVAYATLGDFLSGTRTGPWRDALDLSSLSLHKDLVPHDPAAPPEGGYDALVATLPSLFEAGLSDIEALFQTAAGLMARSALFVATGTVQMNEIAYEGALTYAEWKALYEPYGPLGMRGFEPVGGADPRIPLDTAVRFAADDAAQDSIPGLSYGFLRGFNTSALIAARWPAVLRPGPLARLEYRDLVRPDPAAIPLPYTAGAPAVTMDWLKRAAPAAHAAAFLATHALPTLARLSLSSAPLFRLRAGSPAGALAYVRSIDGEKRQPHQLHLEAPGGAGFVLPVRAGGLTRVAIVFGLPEAVSVAEVVAVNLWGGALPVAATGHQVVVERDSPLGDFALAVRLSHPEVVISRALVTAGAALAADA